MSQLVVSASTVTALTVYTKVLHSPVPRKSTVPRMFSVDDYSLFLFSYSYGCPL